jgi:hypothetical protein
MTKVLMDTDLSTLTEKVEKMLEDILRALSVKIILN